MKTTVEIADDLFERAQRLAEREKTTFRSLAEEGLRLVLGSRDRPHGADLPKLVTMRGRGLSPEFRNASWDKFRDELYAGHGA